MLSDMLYFYVQDFLNTRCTSRSKILNVMVSLIPHEHNGSVRKAVGTLSSDLNLSFVGKNEDDVEKSMACAVWSKSSTTDKCADKCRWLGANDYIDSFFSFIDQHSKPNVCVIQGNFFLAVSSLSPKKDCVYRLNFDLILRDFIFN